MLVEDLFHQNRISLPYQNRTHRKSKLTNFPPQLMSIQGCLDELLKRSPGFIPYAQPSNNLPENNQFNSYPPGNPSFSNNYQSNDAKK